MRLFAAIAMPDAAAAVLEALQDELPLGRLMDSGTLHLTLAFLGQVEGETQRDLHEALEAIRSAQFTLRLSGLGSFGSASPRVIWAGVAPCPPLAELARQVRRAAHRAGIELPRERFRPHVTLARLPPRLDAGELERIRRYLEVYSAAPMPEVEVGEITLYASWLRPEGALYDPVAQYPLVAR